ncbi:hypothetical protein FJZ39_00500 [Candidatus Saccharibacteria bacterium]|nr:hypothetical protein [Candidatus Saccharibacteria bacterium]
MFKRYLLRKLSRYVRLYFEKHPDVILVAVTGSVGKASAKHAIATVVSHSYRVAMHDLSPPRSRIDTLLQILGIHYPGDKKSYAAWFKILRAAKKRTIEPSDAEVIIQEFSPYSSGSMEWFRGVVRPNICVVTSIQSDHLKAFGSIEKLASEILSLANNSRYSIINRDDTEGRFASFITTASFTTYGTLQAAEYAFEPRSYSFDSGTTGEFATPQLPTGWSVTLPAVGETSLHPLVAALTVGITLGMQPQLLTESIRRVQPLPGRMQVLKGARGSWLIDNTSRSTAATALASLQTLYNLEAPSKVVVIGDIDNGNGVREQELQSIGSQCNPNELAWVVTVGKMASQHAAPQARLRGNQVKEFYNALDAGAFIRSLLEPGGVVLVESTESDGYVEEVVKLLLHSSSDHTRLIRQSPADLMAKTQYFNAISSTK